MSIRITERHYTELMFFYNHEQKWNDSLPHYLIFQSFVILAQVQQITFLLLIPTSSMPSEFPNPFPL